MNSPPIEDAFPLAPMQEGMLFNSLRSPGTGVDLLLGVVEITEALDVPRLAAAWQRVVDQHPSLRSGLEWKGPEGLRQVVYREATLPFRTLDWSDQEPDEQEQRWAELVRSDRAEGFELTSAPLTRVTLVRLGTERYRLLWPIHHALVDTLAMTMLLSQVFGCYDAALAGEAYEIEPSVPQRAYSDWLRELDVGLAEGYWREQLAGIGDAVRLGLARSEPAAGASGAGEPGAGGTSDGETPGVHHTQTLALSAEATAALVAWGREHGVSLNTILQGVWCLLLSHYGGQRRVVFGAVKSCRRSCMPGGDRMIGLALNTLPFVVDVDPERELVAWLGEVRRQWVGLREFEHTPLVRMKEWSGVSGRAPLFETVVCFDPLEYAQGLDAQGGDWSRRRVDIFGQPDAPLTLNFYGGERLKLRMTYDPRRLDADVIGRMLGHVETALAALRSGAGASVGSLAILPERERDLLLHEWNAPVAPAPDASCLQHLFEAQAAATPDAPALVHGDEQLSYRELDQRANRLAHALAAAGVQPESTVGLCLERSVEAIVTVLGVLKAGAAYVPFDPSYPPARLAAMADSASLALLVTHGATRGLVESFAGGVHRTPTLCVDGRAAHIAGQPCTSPAVPLAPEALAYVLFTSGSTGKPKGVAMPHAPLVNLMRWQLEQSAAGAGTRTLQFAPLGFDVSCQEIFSTLAGGGTLQLVDEVTRRDPVALLAFVETHAITRVFMPFIALQKLIEAALERDVVPRSLREVITAGEQLQAGPALVEFFQRLDGCTLVNQYGPTECHVVTAHRLSGDPGSWPALPPIGRPIANARAYVLDERLQLAPAGAVGELCLAGVAVARGYLGDEPQTQARFVADPFDPRPGARLYRTGDLARNLSDGSLQFLGRADGQVKLRGYRVELGEIETLLSEHPLVRQARAVIREDRPGDPRLVAYVVSDGAEPPSQGDLRAFLKERLPGFMIPSACVCLDSLPLTPSGKLDRAALPAPEVRSSGDMLVAPRNATEQTIAEIWAALLGVDRVGVHDDFFELGGHSLLAMQVLSRVRDAFGVELPLQRLFEDATIAGLGEHLDTLRWAAGGEGTAPATSDDEVFEL